MALGMREIVMKLCQQPVLLSAVSTSRGRAVANVTGTGGWLSMVQTRHFQTGQWKLVESAEPASTANTQLHASQSRMEKTVNQVVLMGRVGGDPQKRGTQEHPVVVFSLATHSNYNYQTGGILQKTDWHRVCVFKPYLRDSVYKYMGKGQRVYVSGRISYGEVKDENGVPHTTTSVIADDVIFVSNPSNKSPVDDEEVD